MNNLFNRLINSQQRHGLIGMFKVIASHITTQFKIRFQPTYRNEYRASKDRCDTFDKQFDVNTTGFIHHTYLNVDSKNKIHASSYFGSDPKIFRDIISTLSINYPNFDFIDFGSGKGRVILLASEFPFNKIIGIEFSDELNLIAQTNIERYQRNVNNVNIKSICIDAVNYHLPKNPLVCYFFNPFDATIMAKVILNIKKTLLENPRIIFIVYFNPVEADLFDHADCFRRISTMGPVSVWRSTLAAERSV